MICFILEIKNIMGGALNRATRVFRMYNIDNRVERVLSKEKPDPAPRYPTDLQQLQSKNAETNIALETIHDKDKKLLGFLRNVKVSSTGTNPTIRRLGDTSSHPTISPLLNRLEASMETTSADAAFGYVEPQRVPPGRISLRQFLAYLQKHRDAPEEYSIDRFVDMYTIKPETAKILFKHHSLLALQEVSRSKSKAPARPPHITAIEVMGIEAEAAKKPGPETSISAKY
ncbi:unnamed protein product [Rotaria magnacalcarata]|uniref:NADH dehydrogenase [ubiquinone] 1 alpha subcomplex assembly factor 4 n=2 Tax=Rotaria magnacalcarata TaxID=392030 RepID=A0A815XM24_9BILA|nr:unnamed protein product [Rotaria magnacalcarata]CAF3963798.1 unnamed protein product [Rotaria magnacalcarata]CAF4152204.1 unnamed protein product [Rotaria magnacalcarata]CAF4451988.1 unnamed protein product [Rotaria magnacalcarata]